MLHLQEKSFNNQSICDAIIRAQDVMHSSPKLIVRVNKRKSSSMAYIMGKEFETRGVRVGQSPKLMKSVNKSV